MISSSYIEKLIKKHDLVTFPANDLGITMESRIKEGIEGSVWDLTVDDILYAFCNTMEPEATIGRSTRRLPEYQSYKSVKGDGSWGLTSGHYLVKSLETINMPLGFSGLVIPRTSVFRAKMIPTGTRIAPGYSGNIVTGLYVPPCGTVTVVERGARLMSVSFDEIHLSFFEDDKVFINITNEEIAKAVGVYQGIWGKDRVSTQGKTERAF